MSTLRQVVEATEPSLRDHAVDSPSGERFDHVPGTRGFVLEAVYEGYLLHYGTPRAFRNMDADLRLLAGDALYALGLARLADAGDLEAVQQLSDLISASAQAQAEGRPRDAEEAWESTARSLAQSA